MPLTCRWCGGSAGEIVLDLGPQPPCDLFPAAPTDHGEDPTHPLRMWSCSTCGLAQLAEDPGRVEEAVGVEPAALVEHARAALERVGEAGLLPEGASVAEYPSPHGGSWLPMLSERGLCPVRDGRRTQIVVDCFGMMHEPDQLGAVRERAGRLEPGGTLLLQYHSLATILRRRQWNMVRHNHFAYYSTPVLERMLRRVGLVCERVFSFDLYGGTNVLAARCRGGGHDRIRTLVAEESDAGVLRSDVLARLQESVDDSVARLRAILVEAGRRGETVAGYGAASRAVALLRLGEIDASLLRGLADASPAKHGTRMPGTDIPIISPEELVAAEPDQVILFVPDLLGEVSATLPELAGRWVVLP